ncbi:MAG: [acyl-carrier-protein] S-malonyltransferase, partial [Sphingobacteriaceae bacterium]
LETAILKTEIKVPVCPIYQNVTAQPTTDPDTIKINLNKQLTGAVRWTQTMQRMLQDGATSFIETGPGNVLQGLVKKVDRNVVTEHAWI